MSDAIGDELGASARRAGIHAAWRQWSQLGANVLDAANDTTNDVTSIVDPEALLLLSLYLEPAERRLRDVVYWWANVGSDLMSVQRTKTLLKRYPSAAEDRLRTFARWATEAGDKRWQRYEADEPERTRAVLERRGKGVDHPRLDRPAALVLRLRAGFGVNAKADVLAYLLGLQEQPVSTQETADATAYSRPTARGALRDMARARFIQETGRRSARYVAPARSWAGLLRYRSGDTASNGASGPGTSRPGDAVVLPTWQPWADVFACLADVSEWGKAETASDYLRSSKARDLYERHRQVFDGTRMDVPRPEAYRGAAYLDAFQETIRKLTSWVEDRL